MKLNHLAFTGSPGAGKTTYVQKLRDTLQKRGVVFSGFITEEVRENGRRTGFDVVTLDGKRGILSRNNLSSAAHHITNKQHCVGQYIVDIESFEKLVLPLLSNEIPSTAVIIIDEIGKMELFSQKFVKKVREIITMSKHSLIVTIPSPKGRPIPLVEEIRNSTDFRVHTITKSNRDNNSLFNELLEHLLATHKT